MARRIPRAPKPARYRMDTLPGLPGPSQEWSPQTIDAKPTQGHLALDGSVLGPLFNPHPTSNQP
jgi:hypothetical protein